MADNTDIAAGQNVGKKISELSLIPPALLPQIANFVLPAEYGNANYRLTVFDIVGSITKQSLGLDKVDNIPDAEKPLSSFAIQEFQKYWKKTDLIPKSGIENLSQDLDSKRSKNEPIPLEDVSSLILRLNQKMDIDSPIGMSRVTGLFDALNEKAAIGHNHTLTELNGWTNYITGLQQSLSIRPTVDTVNTMIGVAVAEAVSIDTSLLILMNESEAEWS